ncbi:MAG TPA: hypothetical protein VGB30_05840, partial [bacterium]
MRKLIKYPSLILNFLIVLTIIGCSNSNHDDSDLNELLNISESALTVVLDVRNSELDQNYFMGRYPDLFELYEDGKLTEAFYNSDFLIHVGQFIEPYDPSYTGGLITIYPYIIIMSKNNPDKFYLITNNPQYGTADISDWSNTFELREYDRKFASPDLLPENRTSLSFGFPLQYTKRRPEHGRQEKAWKTLQRR